MSLRIRVRLTDPSYQIVAHPVDGPLPLPPETGVWLNDQFTFRRIADGMIERVEDPPEPKRRKSD